MKCYISKYCGFCSGVSLAVQSAYKNKNLSLCMYGEIVHNPEVVEDLQKTIPIAHNTNEILKLKKSYTLIRAHGVSKSVLNQLNNSNIKIIDKTCPKVKHVHKIVENASNNGQRVIIVGNPSHPEVLGIKGWCTSDCIIISDIFDAQKIIPKISQRNGIFCMVSQTTYNIQKYMDIYNYCLEHIPEIVFNNTICNDTSNRQSEIEELSKKVDICIVTGGKSSSNSTKLFEIASRNCDNSYHIETPSELDLSCLDNFSSIALFSGASTPKSSINKVIESIVNYNKSQSVFTEIINL